MPGIADIRVEIGSRFRTTEKTVQELESKVAEFKSQKGRVAPKRAAWMDALEAYGLFVYVSWPADWTGVRRVLGATGW